MISCPNCSASIPADAEQCPACGITVRDAANVELNWLYRSLLDLDQRIARGEGGRSVAQLRQEYFSAYTSKHASTPAATTATTTATGSTAASGGAPAWPAAPAAKRERSHT